MQVLWKGMEIAEHIEFVHERELAPGTEFLHSMHIGMHSLRDDWDHTHLADGTIVWKES